MCCSSWGCKELDTTERLNRTETPTFMVICYSSNMKWIYHCVQSLFWILDFCRGKLLGGSDLFYKVDGHYMENGWKWICKNDQGDEVGGCAFMQVRSGWVSVRLAWNWKEIETRNQSNRIYCWSGYGWGARGLEKKGNNKEWGLGLFSIWVDSWEAIEYSD